MLLIPPVLTLREVSNVFVMLDLPKKEAFVVSVTLVASYLS